MNILYIWDADYPWDVRVEKICRTLADNGFETHIAARNLRGLPELDTIDELHIHRLKSFQDKRLNYLLSFPAFFNPLWLRFIDGIIKNSKINLLIVRDLPLCISAIWAGKRHNIPVILDMAEDYVSMIKDIWRVRKFQGLNLIVRNPYIVRLVERYCINNCDHFFVVVDEAINVISKYGLGADKISIVGNTPPLSILNHSSMTPIGHETMILDRFAVIYTGSIQSVRGIQTVLDSIPEIIITIPNFLFVVVGDGYAAGQLQKRVIDEGLQNYVLWIGWVEHDKLYDYIKASKIGIIPHLVTDHTNTTVPNKLFDYMALGLPVIASDTLPIKRILAEEKCGITFKGGDSKDLVKAILTLHRSDGSYAENGIKAFKRKYNWEADKINLLKSVNLFINYDRGEADKSVR